jgi:hypothetical protein
MPTVSFIGRVLPSVVDFSFTKLPSVQWESPDIGLTMSFALTIEKSAIRIECETNRFIDSDLVPLHRRALDLARAVTDLACFATGFGAFVIFDTFIKPDGQKTALLSHDPSLSPFCTAFRLGPAPNPDLDHFRI